MRKHTNILIPAAVLLALLAVVPSCTTTNRGQNWEQALGVISPSPINPDDAHKSLNLKIDLIEKGKCGRRLDRPMKPQFITIHSTQNYTGDAYAHARALKKGALRGGVCGYMCWHFTVQDDVAIQHVPTSERGEHADYDGPGNRYSIGIEMCEHKGNDLLKTMERTAKLAACLMYHHDIPIKNVVPHYHWPRAGSKPPNKNCPHFLMENGQPKESWKWFVSRVQRHHQRLQQFDEKQRERKDKEQKKAKLKRMVNRWLEKAGDYLVSLS